MRKRNFLFLVISLFAFVSVFAQNSEETDADTPTLKPTFTLGVGMLGYYGDIGNDLDHYSPLVSRPGFELRAGTPLNEWLEADLYVLFGQVSASERTETRNLNFESKITTGGFMFTYNFHHFLKPDRQFEPYLSLGFETVEFLSKTDLYDRNGNMYHYWSDGTIRDVDESASNASDAVVIQRDYIYESDIRELNADGFGKYDERTFAMPVGIGASFLIGESFDLRLGTTMHFTFSNFIDGVTENSEGGRQGSSKNDNFLFSSVSIRYGIDLDKKRRKPTHEYLSPEEMDLLVLNEDTDGDGVRDLDDMCPQTPVGIPVDLNGCPIDTDGDGVPDHRDDEPNTVAGAAVDHRGVTISDEDFLLAYRMYMDSTGEFANVEQSTIATADGPRGVTRGRNYVVQVGSNVEGISEEMTSKILSIPDVKTLHKGDTTIYIVGDYDNLPEAIERESDIEDTGMEGQVMVEESGELIDITSTVDSVKATMNIDPSHVVDDQTVLRVQIGAFRNPLSANVFNGVPNLIELKGNDGIIRYYTGSFSDVNRAAEHKVDMFLKGFEGAFLVAFRNGERISLKEAGATIEGPETVEKDIVSPINVDMISFKVQVGAFIGNVPAEVMNLFIEIGEVSSVKGENSIKYYFGDFRTRVEAEQAKEDLISQGLNDAFVVGAFSGHIITAEEAQRILDL